MFYILTGKIKLSVVSQQGKEAVIAVLEKGSFFGEGASLDSWCARPRRLARVLLLMAQFGKESEPEPVVPKVSHEKLAEMIGTTCSRVSFFMNKFRKLGFVYYNGGLHVHSSLLNIILHD